MKFHPSFGILHDYMMREFFTQGPEGPRQESLIITPDSLMQDNHTPFAQQRREEFESARIGGALIGVDRCSDARVSVIGNSISVGSISAAETPTLNLAKDRGLAAWMSLSHFDCGGSKAKQKIGDEPQNGGIEKYVAEKIAHPDPIIQTIITAEEIASLSEKPVLAAVQDHLDHTIYPIAYFQMEDGQMTSVSAVRTRDILKYNPDRIYEAGIPTIGERSMPNVFRQLLDQNRRDVQKTLAQYPNLREMQEVQKPRMVMFSTDIRSAKIKYPNISAVPGSMFKVFVPRQKVDGDINILDEDLLNSLNQLQYPISQAVANADSPDMPFSNTDRLIIETGNLSLSRSLAQKAMEQEWMQDWFNLPDRQIILVQTLAGIISAAEQLEH